MNVGQVIMALINIIGLILMGLSYIIPVAMFVTAIAIHRIAIFLFCLLMIFSFGPLDDVSELGDQLARVMSRKSFPINEDIISKDEEAKAAVSNKTEQENRI